MIAVTTGHWSPSVPVMVLALLLSLPQSPARAAELGSVPRTIASEPAYRTGAPRYCLLVFGPEAATRVWLVQDGERLFVDRNGNGDLTEAGEEVAAGEGSDPDDGVYQFKADSIEDRGQLHKDLTVELVRLDHLARSDPEIGALLARDPQRRFYIIGLDVDLPGRAGAGVGGRVRHLVLCRDAHGVLSFSSTPAEAPIVHFGGPWEITLYEPARLTLDRQVELMLGVGTPGLGPGTTAFVAYEKLIPPDAHPVVELTLPAREADQRAITQRLELKERC
jgi:hypothetical protein